MEYYLKMKQFLIEHSEWLIGIVTTISAWFGGQRLKRSSEKSVELENLSTVRELEKQIVDDTQDLVSDLRETIKQLQEIVESKNQYIKDQKALMKMQQKELEAYKSKYGEL